MCFLSIIVSLPKRANNSMIASVLLPVLLLSAATTTKTTVAASATTDPVVTALWLVDCKTGKDLFELHNDTVVDMNTAALKSKNLTVRAEITGTTEWVEFDIDNTWIQFIDDSDPYYMGSKNDDTGELYPSIVFETAGKHILKASPKFNEVVAGDDGVTDPAAESIRFLQGTLGIFGSGQRLRSQQLDDGRKNRKGHCRRELRRLQDAAAAAGSYSISFQVVLAAGPGAEPLAADTVLNATNVAKLIQVDGDSQVDLIRQSLMNVYPSDVSPYTVSVEGSINGGDPLVTFKTLTLAWEGPEASELSTSLRAPDLDITIDHQSIVFEDYRTDVIFKHVKTGTEYEVGGYFALSRNPANNVDEITSSGGVWLCHFAPQLAGDYQWTVSFKLGVNVTAAVNAAAAALVGQSGSYFDGQVGSFTVVDNPVAVDGRLKTTGINTLIYSLSKKAFVPVEVNETSVAVNLLESSDYDGAVTTAGKTDYFDAYKALYVEYPGTTWKQGKGKGVIGAINKYVNIDNATIVSVRVFGTSPFVNYNAHGSLVYDVSKLAQWNVVVGYASYEKHVAVRFQLFNNEVSSHYDIFQKAPVKSGSTSTSDFIPMAAKIYYREMISRFGHHIGIIWDLGTNRATNDQMVQPVIDYIRQIDPYNNPILVNGQYDVPK